MNKIITKIKNFIKDPFFLRKWVSPYETRYKDDNQLSVRIVGSSRERGHVFKADCFMFVQDMYTGLIPYREEDKYPVKIVPTDASKEKLIAEGISNRGYSSRLLHDSLRDFVETTAHVMFQDGIALYEIVSKKNNDVLQEFSLVLMQPQCLFKFFGNYYQYVSWVEAKRSGTKVGIIKIPSEKVLRIEMPKVLGGKRGLRKTLKRLWQISKEIHPHFHMEAMEKGIDIGFDFNEYIRFKYLETAKITKKFGWDQRQRTSNYLTEFNFMMDYIRHKRVDIIVRQSIINALNGAFNGKTLNLGVEIVVENFPTLEDVEEQQIKLKNGNITFMEIYEALKL